MTIPESAKHEAIVGHITIYDVSHILANEAVKLAHKAIKDGKKRKRHFGVRDPHKIDTAIVHKSGGNGPSGFEGCRSTTSFVVYHRGWEGAAYTFWFSRHPDFDDEGRIVVYRMQPDHVRSWHTGGRMNEIGIGLGVQGNYDGQWDLLSNGIPRIDREPTDEQWEALEEFLPYLNSRYGIEFGRKDEDDDWGLTDHWEHGKPVCPGDALRHWVMRTRGESSRMLSSNRMYREVFINDINPYKFTPKQYQAALHMVGFDCGPIDGIIGERTRGALEAFQSVSGLKVDGWYGETTARELQAGLRDRGLLSRVEFEKRMIELGGKAKKK